MKNETINLLLVAIIILGLFLRTFNLGRVPAGLHFDEAQAGYNSFLLYKLGKNINGEKLPVDINSFGDYRPALVSYLTIPAVAVLGLSEFSTRLPTALVGTITIVLAYIFALLCFQKRSVALLAALLTALSPMAIIFDRATTEGVTELAFEITALIFLILAFKKRNPWLLILVYLFWILGYFTYQISRVLTPLMAMSTIAACYWQFRPTKKLVLLAAIPIISYLIFPFFFFLRTPFGQGRFRQVSIFTFPEVQRSLDEQIREDGAGTSTLTTRVFHNKLVAYAYDIAHRYSVFFSPETVLFSLPQPDRYLVPQSGPVTIMEFFGLLLVLALVFLRTPAGLSLLPLVLLLLAPLPSAVTFEAEPNFLRAIFMTPYLQITAAAGLITFLTSLRKNVKYLAIFLFSFLTLWQTVYFLHQYQIHEPNHNTSIASRSTEMKSLALYLNTLPKGKPVLLPEYNGPYIYYLFYNRLNIFDQTIEKNGPGFGGNWQLNNLYFFDGQCTGPDRLFARHYQILILKEQCSYPSWSTTVQKFYRSDGSLSHTAYRLDEQSYRAYETQYLALSTGAQREEFLKELSKTFIPSNN